MKKAILTGVFVFSLTLNLAVAVTLVRHAWLERTPSSALKTVAPALTNQDVERIRKLSLRHGGLATMQARNEILAKNFELLDLIAKHPADTAAAEQRISELIEAKGKIEKDALARICAIMAALPPEKRQAFAVFLKNRSCMMSGMCFGQGGWRGGRGRPGGKGSCCPMRPPVTGETSR
ncbi:MAG: periplasmic heavy metal sensor [Desulfomonilaceae bacterium]